MRVLLVSHRYPPHGRSGVEQCARMLAGGLTDLGDQVAIVTRQPTLPQRRPFVRRETDPSGAPIYRLVGGDAGLDTFLDYHLPAEAVFEEAMLDLIPDVVHFHHLKDMSPRMVEIARERGAAVVLTLHDFYVACSLVHLRKLAGGPCDGPAGGLECAATCFAAEGAAAIPRWTTRAAYFRRILALAERVICPSRSLADFFAEFGVAPERLRLLPNGIAVEALPDVPPAGEDAPTPGTLTLAFLGSVVDYKGVHIVVEALRRARLPGVALTIFGQIMDDDYARALRRRAAEIPGLTFRLYGGYKPADLPLLLRGVDCVLIPSLVPESFSLTAREALVQGIPVVAARIGALPEAIVDDENGFTYTPDQPTELAVILQRLAEDESLLPRLRAGARRARVLTAPEHTAAVRAVYEEAIVAFARTPPEPRGDAEERRALYEALLSLGFLAPDQR